MLVFSLFGCSTENATKHISNKSDKNNEDDNEDDIDFNDVNDKFFYCD